MIELRWARSLTINTKADRLQWREIFDHDQGEYISRNWTDVPIVVVEEETDNENKL